ncbi:MAG: hypothetical protein RL235_822 [Chlamydiota bacterium]|jgi:hypothetical protein
MLIGLNNAQDLDYECVDDSMKRERDEESNRTSRPHQKITRCVLPTARDMKSSLPMDTGSRPGTPIRPNSPMPVAARMARHVQDESPKTGPASGILLFKPT